MKTIKNGFARICATALLTGALAVAGVLPAAAQGTSAAKEWNMDAGILLNGSMLVPLRDIAEALEAELVWNGETQSITLSKGSSRVHMTINSSAVQVNDSLQTLEVAPRIEYERTFVPLRLIGEAFGAAVEWDGDNLLATIRAPGTTLYVSGHPYLEWNGTYFVYEGELANGLPHGQGVAIKGTSLYDDIWYNGLWDNGIPVQLAADHFTIYVNGNYLNSDHAPIVRNDVVYLPLWALANQLRLSTEPIFDLLRINHPERTLLLGADSSLVTYYDQNKQLHQARLTYPTVVEQDVFYVPISFVTDYLNIQAAWGEHRRIDLTAPNFSASGTLDLPDSPLKAAAQKLQEEVAAESFWKTYGQSLWTSRYVRYPGTERFDQYERVRVESYNGLTATIAGGGKSIKLSFSSLSAIDSGFYNEDPLGAYTWSDETKELIRQQKVKIGMNEEQVLMSWGEPDSVRSAGNLTQWAYTSTRSVSALYFTDGVLELFH